jgi:hypothetical protein
LSEPPAGGADVETAFSLSEDEAELIAAEALAASQALEDPRRAEAQQLASVAPTGHVPAELVGLLEQITLASLQGGRARHLYRAEGERTLVGLLLRTPRGRKMQSELEKVNTALTALRGQRLAGVRVAMRAPGNFVIELQTDSVSVTLSARPHGLSVESLST